MMAVPATDQLNPSSRMECPRHGVRRPTFICQHLRTGLGAGFHQPEGPPDPECPFQQAWCDACDRVLEAQGGEWNDESESHAGILPVCEGCFEEIRRRNAPAGGRR
jgi:hypothetical protein